MHDSYYDDLVFERLINVEKKNVTLTGTSNIMADVGDIVEISYAFNDSVDDGKISISYGGSEDNITSVTASNGIICFNTSDYLQGEYDLVLRYYDSSVYNEISIPVILELYQPTNITADKKELNITLGEDNTYTVNFQTSRDSYDDVIWGSIDVYVDDNIIDTLIVDDTTGNTAGITLDDYILEDLTPGNHILRAVFTSDDMYVKTSETSVELNVGGEVIIEIPETVNAVMNKDYNITPVILQFNNQPIKQGTLTFTIGHTTHNIDLSSINDTIGLNASYDTGVYTVNMRYHDDTGTYPDSVKTFTLIVRTDTPASFSTSYNTTVRTDVYIELRDNKGRLVNRTVNITLPDGSKIENAEINSTNLYDLVLNYIPAGENTIIVEAEENLTYTKLNQSYTFNVTKVKTNITGNINRKEINNTYGTFRLAMNDTISHGIIGNATLKIINLENNEIIGTGITANNSGLAEITANISHAGDYQLKIVFSGNEYFESTEIYRNITVPKKTTRINMNTINTTHGDTVIEISVADQKTSNIIIDAPVTITLPDNSQINTNTGKTGKVSVPLNLPVGENNITIEYPGTSDLNATTRTVTINITPRESITGATITNSSVNNVTVQISVTDKTSGEKITNGDIEVTDKDGNRVGTGSLDANGTATITTTVNSKDVTELTVNYLGNINYTGSSYTIDDLVVVGRLSDINYAVDNVTLGNITVNITVVDPVTDTPIPNIPVQITYPNGTTEELNTDTNGNITLHPALPVGENNITITVQPNNQYNGTTRNITFTVTMRESTTTATITNNTLQNTTITVRVTDKTTGTPVSSGNIEVTDTTSGEVIGRATLHDENPVNITLNIDTTGYYNISVEFKGNTNYTSSSKTLENINITKRQSIVIINTTSDVYGNTSINVTIKDPITNNTINNAPITVTLPDGSTIESNTGATGTVKIPVNTPIGESTISVEYPGDDNYNKSETTININTNKRESHTSATIINSSVRNTTLSVNITDKITNIPVTNGNITVRDKNTNTILGQATLNGTNTATITTNIDTKGNYTLIIDYSGNDYYYNSSNILSNITVTGRISEVNITPVNTTNGNITVNITVCDPVTDTPIANTTVIITYPNGTTQETVTDENGTVSITPALPVEENNITVTVPENDYYNKTTETTTLNITTRQSNTKATLANNTIRNTTITVTITDKTTSWPVTSGNITVINKENNAIVGKVTLNGTNKINITTTITQHGTYDLLIKYEGNTNYTESQDNLDNINITRREAIINITTTSDTINDTRITITVKDTTTGEVIPNAPIIVTLPDGQTINTHTGTTGTVTQTITINTAGNNTIKVEFTGTTTYNNTTTTHNINIKKLPSKVTLNKQTTYLGDTITLTAHVTDLNNNPLNGGKLVFKIKNVTLKDTNGEPIYARVTGGIASINYTIPIGYQAKTYKLGATYEGNQQHTGNTSNTPLLNIKQRQALLTLTTSGNTEVNHNNTFHVTITDKHDPTREVNGHIIFKIDGITLKDNNGETIQVEINNNTVEYTYTMGPEYSARKHTITAVLINQTYMRSQANNTFNITKTRTTINLNTPQITNKQATLTGTITDSTGQTVKGTNKIAVKIDGKTIKTSNGKPQYHTITDGNINITLKDNNYADGEHTIEVVTGERNAYTGARNQTTLTINNNKITKTNNNNVKTSTITRQQPVNIIPDKQIALTGETNTISIKILDTNNKAIKKGKITFTSNGKTLSTTTVNNGRATLNHKYTTPGTYNIIATYTDNTGTYTTTKKQFNIQIIGQPQNKTTITANNTQTIVGETLTYTTLYTDQHHNKITTGTAQITIQNKTTTHKITNGITITPITINKAGKYNITITAGNTKITRTITVNKQTPQITINKQTLQAGTTNTITTTITTPQQVPLNEGKIQWKINGITLKNNNGQPIQTTIKDGTSTLNYEIPITWAGKQINITTTYTGSTNYNIKATTTRTKIPQLTAQATITITPTTPKTRDNTTIKITITDKNTKKPVTGTTKIAIKLNGKTINTPKITNGSITLKYKLPLLKTNKTHHITIVYGNKNYKRLDTTKKFNIQRINTTLTLKDTTIKKGQTLHIKTTIKDTNGETMKRNDTYCVKLNGKTIHTNRLKNGQIDIKLPINYKKGKTYTLTIKTGNNYYYNGLTKTVKLTVI